MSDSFSGKVRKELLKVLPDARNMQLAELDAFLLFCGKIRKTDAGAALRVRSENEGLLRKCFTILSRAFTLGNADIVFGTGSLEILPPVSEKILMAVKWESGGHFCARDTADRRLLTESGSRRAFIRGCFLTCGSITDPSRFYHCEFACPTGELADQIAGLLPAFGIEAHTVVRKKQHVVYIKEGNQISDLLKVMEAEEAILAFENVRVIKDVRNRVNRRVNCETANLYKTSAAAAVQLRDSDRIRETAGLSSLPPNLAEAAAARLENPDASLTELGEMMNPPLGKSGMNHRFRKIHEIAEQTMFQQEGFLDD